MQGLTRADHEIFRLRDEVIASEGQNTTFYSWLGIAQSAGQKDIDKAYRKLSRTLHPDKARSSWISTYDQYDPAKAKTGDTPGVKVQQHKKPSKREINAFNKAASARFARLGVVANILRGSERARYDHFLYNGFPAWRGTGYYYQRYRPGLGSVIFGLFIFVGGGVHYLALFLNWRKHKEFVGRYIRHARQTAWGDEGALGAVPGLGPSAPGMPADEEQEQPMNWNRRERRQRDKERAKDKKGSDVKVRPKDISAPIDPRVTSGPQGAKKRTVAENGKVLIVDSVGNVYLEQEAEDGQIHELLLDVCFILIPGHTNFTDSCRSTRFHDRRYPIRCWSNFQCGLTTRRSAKHSANKLLKVSSPS